MSPLCRRLVFVLACGLSACTSFPAPEERRALADTLAASRDWEAVELSAGLFDLRAYLPRKIERNVRLTVYIEGDGLAWVSSSQPSFDPTPRDPLALRLALAQPEGNTAYLARPCQFNNAAAKVCAERYWTGQRFAPEVIEATNLALDQLKALFGAQHLILVGYSGGGAVATLLASQRGDIERLVTVAGNLDTASWTALHRVSPLSGSLNPADFAARLSTLPQTHFVGERDKVIPPKLVHHYPTEFLGPGRKNLKVLQGFDHACCWAEHWVRLWQEQ